MACRSGSGGSVSPGQVTRGPLPFHLAHSLACTSALRALNLKGCTIGDDGTEALANVLPQHSQLTSLDLSCCLIGGKGSQCLSRAVAQLSELRELHLMCNRIGDDEAQGLIVRAARLSHLQILNLRHCDVTAACIHALQMQLPSLTWPSADCIACRTCGNTQLSQTYYLRGAERLPEHACHELQLYSPCVPDLIKLMITKTELQQSLGPL